jgi:integrase/recombinase XerD
MTPLQQRMIEDLQLRGMSARTEQMYVRAVRQLAQHYHKPPDQISDEELRQYFLYVKNVKHWSRSGTTIALCGLKFFYEHTLERSLATLQLVRPPREKKLPVVLSREEVRQVLSQVRLLRYRTCLTTIYGCGLRLQEGTHLQVSDIDSARQLIHVHHGKGGKDRYVPLPDSTLELLRQYWKTHGNPIWIFPASGRGGIHRSTAERPTPLSNVQDAFRLALHQSGISKKASVHTLRHYVACRTMSRDVTCNSGSI